MKCWLHPDQDNEVAATAHLTFEGVRNGHLGGMPPDVAARVPARSGDGDWQAMQLPGRMPTQRAPIEAHRHHVSRLDEIAEYLCAGSCPR